MPNINEILSVILGGGRGARLFPLTEQRSKPAVPMAGKYRLIDIPISNCINSNIFRIAVLTQFNSVSLHRHIAGTYQFDMFHSGWVQIWAAEQTMENTDWYQGTADAVRKQKFEIYSTRAKYVLILSGDHLYRMDYDVMARFHWENNADITVAVQPVSRDSATRLGVLKRNSDGRIVSFAEKPKDPAKLDEMISRDDPEKPYLGSMGIYLFKTEALFDLLANSNLEDFGNHVIPAAMNTHSIYGYEFTGFWEDIGTIRSFYETNLMLSTTDPAFSFFDPERPIYTHQRQLPGSTIQSSTMKNVLISEGCCIDSAEINHSVVGVRSQIRTGCRIQDSVLMGADYYDRILPGGLAENIPIGLGNRCDIEGAIIDKNARLGDNVVIRPYPLKTELDGEGYVVRDGIVVIPKNAIIQPGTYIGPDNK